MRTLIRICLMLVVPLILIVGCSQATAFEQAVQEIPTEYHFNKLSIPDGWDISTIAINDKANILSILYGTVPDAEQVETDVIEEDSKIVYRVEPEERFALLTVEKRADAWDSLQVLLNSHSSEEVVQIDQADFDLYAVTPTEELGKSNPNVVFVWVNEEDSLLYTLYTQQESMDVDQMITKIKELYPGN